MRTNNRAIDQPVFHIRIVRKIEKHTFPNTLLAPPGKPFVDAVPMAVLSRQQSPLGTTAAYPQHGFNKTTTDVFVLTNISMRVFSQKIQNFCPLIVSESHICHETILLIYRKCQQNLVKHEQYIIVFYHRQQGRFTSC